MPRNLVTRFALLFVIGYFGLTGLFSLSPISQTSNALLRKVSRGVLNTTLPKLQFNTLVNEVDGKKVDNNMKVEFQWTQKKIDQAIAQARRTGQANIEVPYRFISYLLFEFFIVPIIFLWALNIATPMPRREKWIWGTLAFVLLMAFLFAKLWMMTLFSVSKAQIEVYELSHTTMTRLQWWVSVMTMGFSIILTFFLWLALLFSRSALKTSLMSWLDDKGLS